MLISNNWNSKKSTFILQSLQTMSAKELALETNNKEIVSLFKNRNTPHSHECGGTSNVDVHQQKYYKQQLLIQTYERKKIEQQTMYTKQMKLFNAEKLSLENTLKQNTKKHALQLQQYEQKITQLNEQIETIVAEKKSLKLTCNQKMLNLLKKCFLAAVGQNDHEIVQECLANNIDLSITTTDGLNALHVASRNGKSEMILLLLDNNMEINKPVVVEGAYKQWTPLHFACVQNNPVVVLLLLKHGANPSASNTDNHHPINIAIQYYNHNIVNAILEWCNDKKTQKR